MKQEVFYVGIENPSNLRRGILETSKEMLHFLQRYEKLKEIRAQKYSEIAKLKVIYEDLKASIPFAKAELPKVDIKTLPKHSESKKEEYHDKVAARVQAEQKVPSAPKKLSGIEKLEQELADIEEKLKNIA